MVRCPIFFFSPAISDTHYHPYPNLDNSISFSTFMWILHEPLNSSCKVFKQFFLENLIIFQRSFLLIYLIKHLNYNLSCKNEKKNRKTPKKSIQIIWNIRKSSSHHIHMAVPDIAFLVGWKLMKNNIKM